MLQHPTPPPTVQHPDPVALPPPCFARRQIGTTKRGIGPAYSSKSTRNGLRLGDIRRPQQFAGGRARTWRTWRLGRRARRVLRLRAVVLLPQMRACVVCWSTSVSATAETLRLTGQPCREAAQAVAGRLQAV